MTLFYAMISSKNYTFEMGMFFSVNYNFKYGEKKWKRVPTGMIYWLSFEIIINFLIDILDYLLY